MPAFVKATTNKIVAASLITAFLLIAPSSGSKEKDKHTAHFGGLILTVTAIDSTGIGRFIWSYNKIAAMGGDMRMAGATGHVLQTFRVSLLDTVFSFYDSVEEARQV